MNLTLSYPTNDGEILGKVGRIGEGVIVDNNFLETISWIYTPILFRQFTFLEMQNIDKKMSWSG